MNYEQKMQSFFYRLDNANSETEISPILAEMNAYIDTIQDEKMQSLAQESFKYYFTKRLSRIEDEVNRLKNTKNEYVLS
jgi:hypothetical protein